MKSLKTLEMSLYGRLNKSCSISKVLSCSDSLVYFLKHLQLHLENLSLSGSWKIAIAWQVRHSFCNILKVTIFWKNVCQGHFFQVHSFEFSSGKNNGLQTTNYKFKEEEDTKKTTCWNILKAKNILKLVFESFENPVFINFFFNSEESFHWLSFSFLD